MNIFFKKTAEPTYSNKLTFDGLGITQCYVKDLNAESDRDSILRTMHRHTSYEVHIILSGSQDFKIDDRIIRVSSGELLLIPPYACHTAICENENYKKRAITFALANESDLASKVSHIDGYFKAKSPDRLIALLDVLQEESYSGAPFCESISDLAALECILLILRSIGADDRDDLPQEKFDARVTMAKQFIQDNIQYDISIQSVASYCYIGKKQLSRIFYKAERCTVAEYIRIHKINHIKILLASSQYSIRQISEIMNFSSEHYLNTFFKKHVGITPGEYRKSML